MADERRSGGGGNKPPSRVTQQRLSPPAAERVTSPMGAVRPPAGDGELEDPTQATSGGARRFAADESLRTTLVPGSARRRAGTPAGGAPTIQNMPSVIVAAHEALPAEPPTTSLAATAAMEVRVGGGAVEAAPRTQVWVATHKPPETPDARLILLTDPDSPRAASFRVLRHRLQERGDPRVIAVTSARPREGKTTCAVNLAMALGECGRARVLLAEANLRTPALAPLFGFMPPECFAQQMTRHKEKPLDPWSVVEVFSPSLHVLAVKPQDAGGRPLLDGPAVSIALEMLRQANYDYIVLDTPPVLGAADVNLIEDVADGVLFVARARETPARALRDAVDQLAPAKLLGVTLFDA